MLLRTIFGSEFPVVHCTSIKAIVFPYLLIPEYQPSVYLAKSCILWGKNAQPSGNGDLDVQSSIQFPLGALDSQLAS
jgi:hypothetical protein